MMFLPLGLIAVTVGVLFTSTLSIFNTLTFISLFMNKNAVLPINMLGISITSWKQDEVTEGWQVHSENVCGNSRVG